MTTNHVFVFNEDEDRFLKLTEESHPTNCSGIVHNANFFMKNTAGSVQVSMVGKYYS